MIQSTVPRTEIYDRLAPIYDHLHRQFLRMAGGKAQAALEGSVATLLCPGDKVLDAGCGTGRLADQLLSAQPDLDMTLLDPAPAMLRRCDQIAARRVFGSLAGLPFPDAGFDLTICAWALETAPDEVSGFAELVRVTKPGGHIVLALCTQNEGVRPLDMLTMRSIALLRTGRFLNLQRIMDGLARPDLSELRILARYGVVSALLMQKR